MVIDSSAIIAILFEEAGWQDIFAKIIEADSRMICAGNLLEIYLVTQAKKGDVVLEKLDSLMVGIKIEVRPFDLSLVTLAREANAKYGEGRHPAALNFGDCMAYALAQSLKLPLLFKGNDFAQTDVVPA